MGYALLSSLYRFPEREGNPKKGRGLKVATERDKGNFKHQRGAHCWAAFLKYFFAIRMHGVRREKRIHFFAQDPRDHGRV